MPGKRKEKREGRKQGNRSEFGMHTVKVGIEAEENQLTHLGVFEASSWVQYLLCADKGEEIHNGSKDNARCAQWTEPPS